MGGNQSQPNATAIIGTGKGGPLDTSAGTIASRGISFTYDHAAEPALRDITLTVPAGECIVLCGASGCGKTTLLSLIGGLDSPGSGQIYFDGQDIAKTGLSDHRKNHVAFIFQAYNLIDYLTPTENVSLTSKLPPLPILERLGLTKEEAKRNVLKLSGGQQQRVAIARSLVNEPEILLLDEPLGALDLKLRKEMQLELKRLQREMNITFIYVTHDQEEALTMSDTVVVMNGGKVQQIGTPEDIYNEPKNAFVADFIGDSNIVDGVMHRDFLVSFSGVEFPCVDRGFAREESVQVVVRPEDIEVVSPVEGQLVGVVNDVIFKGVHFEMHVECEVREWLIHSTRACTPGETIGMRIGPNEIHIMSRSEG